MTHTVGLLMNSNVALRMAPCRVNHTRPIYRFLGLDDLYSRLYVHVGYVWYVCKNNIRHTPIKFVERHLNVGLFEFINLHSIIFKRVKSYAMPELLSMHTPLPPPPPTKSQRIYTIQTSHPLLFRGGPDPQTPPASYGPAQMTSLWDGLTVNRSLTSD